MSSGVDFGEERDGGRDLDRLWIDMVLGTGDLRTGTVAAISQFNRRIALPGTRYHYASIGPDVREQAAEPRVVAQYRIEAEVGDFNSLRV